VSEVRVLVEVIAGPKVLATVDSSATVEETAKVLSEVIERPLVNEEGKALSWKLYAPGKGGNIAPLKPDATLDVAKNWAETVTTAGKGGGFAGPGEHDGDHYLFRVRFFVPKPRKPRPPAAKPPPIEDEEALDLTDIDAAENALETVRRRALEEEEKKKKKKRKRKRQSDTGTMKRRRKRPAGETGPIKRRRKKRGGTGEMAAVGSKTGETAAIADSPEPAAPATPDAPAETPEAAPAPAAPAEAKAAPAPAPAESKPAPAEAKPAPAEAKPAPAEAKPAPSPAPEPAVEAKPAPAPAPAPVEAKPAPAPSPAPAEARPAPAPAPAPAAEAKPAPAPTPPAPAAKPAPAPTPPAPAAKPAPAPPAAKPAPAPPAAAKPAPAAPAPAEPAPKAEKMPAWEQALADAKKADAAKPAPAPKPAPAAPPKPAAPPEPKAAAPAPAAAPKPEAAPAPKPAAPAPAPAPKPAAPAPKPAAAPAPKPAAAPAPKPAAAPKPAPVKTTEKVVTAPPLAAKTPSPGQAPITTRGVTQAKPAAKSKPAKSEPAKPAPPPPAKKAKKGGSNTGLFAALAVLGLVAAGFGYAFVTRGGDDAAPSPTTSSDPAPAPSARLSQDLALGDVDLGEGDAGDAVAKALAGYRSLGLKTPGDASSPEVRGKVEMIANALKGACEGLNRFDACMGWSRASYAYFAGCQAGGCDGGTSGQWFVQAIDGADKALTHAASQPDAAKKGQATRLLVAQSIRLGAANQKTVTAKAPRIGALGDKACASAASTPDCQALAKSR